MENQKTSNLVFTAAALCVTLITFFVFLSSIDNGFVNWDDIDYVYENMHIRTLDLETVRWAFSGEVVENWNPLALISYAVDYALWGGSPWGFHLTNVFLHSFNSFLVFMLTAVIVAIAKGEETPNARTCVIAAVFASLLFSLHPLRVESVAWISARKDVLSGTFFLLSLVLYALYAHNEKKPKGVYAASLISFVFALMSKPSVIMLPVVLLVLDWYPLKRFDLRKGIVEKVPFFALSLLSAIITMGAIYGTVERVSSVQSGPLERVSMAIYSTSFYMYKTVFPWGLSPLYPVNEDTLSTVAVFTGFILLAAVFVLCYVSLKRTKAPMAAWVFFLVMLFPVMGFLKFGRQPVADRFTYLPVISFCVLAGAYIAARGKNESIVKIKAAGFCLLCVILAVLTIKQVAVWKDSISLWTRQIELYPGLSDVAYNNRGSAYFVMGDFESAIKDYDMAVDIKTKNPEVYYNRAYARYYTGDYYGALEDFMKYSRYEKTDAKTFLELGKWFNKEKDHVNASIALGAALQLDPESTEARAELGRALKKIKKKPR